MTIHPQFLVDEKGKKKGVFLSLKDYNELLECAQDVIDAALIDEVRDEPLVSLEDFKKRSPRRHAK